MDNAERGVIGDLSSLVEVNSSGVCLRVTRIETWNEGYDIWCCRVEDVPASVLSQPANCKWLANDGARWDQFRFAKDRNLFLATRLLVRAVLSQYGDLPPEAWCFEKSSSGRPYIAPQMSAQSGLTGLQFSLSRSGSLAVCAVSRGGNVGIDIEERCRRVDVVELSAGVIAPSELLELKRVPERDRPGVFLRYWTLKEAYLKARGLGLSVDPGQVVFSGLEGRPVRLSSAGSIEDQPDSWHFAELLLFDSYMGALAYQNAPT